MLEWTEVSERMTNFKQLVDWDVFTDEQKFILACIVENNFSQRKIQEEWANRRNGEKLSFEAIQTCVIRSGLGRPWEKGMQGGNENYLCDADMKTLEEIIEARARLTKALTTQNAIDEAEKLKAQRYQMCCSMLNFIGYKKLAESIRNVEVREPSRPWLNQLQKHINFYLSICYQLESTRYFSCALEIIDSYFANWAEIFRATPEQLFFVADETMMSPNKPLKVVVPRDISQYIEPLPPDSAHITAFCVNNLSAVKPPPLIIVSKLKRIPQELKTFVDSGMIWLSSSPSGWMNRQLFLAWTINFCNWLYQYRMQLPATIAHSEAVLLMDGHTSRECPAALEILQYFNCRVIILPAHTTHVLQLFDVGLASPMKKRFTLLLQELWKDKTKYVEGNTAATMRKLSVEAFIGAWNTICNPTLVSSAAAAVGIKPVNPNAVREKPYVRDFTADERQQYESFQRRMNHRLQISNCCLTSREKIAEIRDSLHGITGNNIICSSYEPNGEDFAAYHYQTTKKFFEDINASNDSVFSFYPFGFWRY